MLDFVIVKIALRLGPMVLYVRNRKKMIILLKLNYLNYSIMITAPWNTCILKLNWNPISFFINMALHTWNLKKYSIITLFWCSCLHVGARTCHALPRHRCLYVTKISKVRKLKPAISPVKLRLEVAVKLHPIVLSKRICSVIVHRVRRRFPWSITIFPNKHY